MAKKKRRLGCLWKVLAGLAAALAVLAVVGPSVAAPFVRDAIVRAIEAEAGGEATIDALRFSLLGSASVEGIEVRDARGRPLAAIEHAAASFNPLDLLRRRLEVTAEVRGVEGHLHLDEGGRWSFEDIGGDAGAEGEDGASADPSPLPDAALHLEGTDLRLVVHGPDGDASFAGSFAVDLADLATPASLRAHVALAGPDGPAGAVGVTGEVTVATDGRAAGFQPTGHLDARVDGVDLAAFAHLAARLAPVEDLAGVVDGTIAVHLGPSLALRSDTSLAVRDLRYRGPEPDARFTAREVRLEGESTSEKDGGFRQVLRLGVDDFLSATLDGTWTPGRDGGAEIAGSGRLDGSLTELTGALHGWLPLQEGVALGGRVTVRGDFAGALADQALRRAHSTVRVELTELEVRDGEGRPVPLDELTALTFSTGANFDGETGRLSLADLSLAAGPVQAAGTVEVRGLGGEEGAAVEIDDSSFEIDADLDRLRATLAGFLDLEGAPFGGRLHANLTARGGVEKTRLVGKVRTTDLVLGADEGGAPRDYGRLVGNLDAWYFSAADRLKLTLLEVKGDPLTATLRGKVLGVTSKAPVLDLTVDVTTSLVRLQRAFPFPADLPVREISGEAATRLAARGTREELEVEGTVELTELAFGVVTEATGEELWPVVEPRVAVDVKAVLLPSAGDLRLDRLHVEAQGLRADITGRVRNAMPQAPGADVAEGLVLEGVRGEAFYVPDRMGALLEPWLPGTLSGEEEQRVTFALDGRAREIDPLAVLAGARGTAEVGLGRFVTGGFDTTGTVQVELDGEQATWEGTLAANGGTLALHGAVDLRETKDEGSAPRSTLAVEMKDVGANSKLSPLLGLVHPAFSAVNTLGGSEIDGLIDCKLDLSFDGALTSEVLEGGWEAFPKSHLNGTGSFALRGASLTGSPLFAKMLGEIGLDPGRTLDLRPLEFSVEAGRVRYAKPWTWTLGETKTTFTGSIGLDESLALTWNVPVDDALVKKYDVLSALRGQVLAVPLGGTIRAPRLEWQGLLRDLAQSRLRGLAERELRDRLGLGGGRGTGDGAKADDPASLLAAADKLWGSGKKEEAAALYGRIRKKYKLSLVYVLNRDRIKKRAKYRND